MIGWTKKGYCKKEEDEEKGTASYSRERYGTHILIGTALENQNGTHSLISTASCDHSLPSLPPTPCSWSGWELNYFLRVSISARTKKTLKRTWLSRSSFSCRPPGSSYSTSVDHNSQKSKCFEHILHIFSSKKYWLTIKLEFCFIFCNITIW